MRRLPAAGDFVFSMSSPWSSSKTSLFLEGDTSDGQDCFADNGKETVKGRKIFVAIPDDHYDRST
jgi:hypothetical protein